MILSKYPTAITVTTKSINRYRTFRTAARLPRPPHAARRPPCERGARCNGVILGNLDSPTALCAPPTTPQLTCRRPCIHPCIATDGWPGPACDRTPPSTSPPAPPRAATAKQCSKGMSKLIFPVFSISKFSVVLSNYSVGIK